MLTRTFKAIFVDKKHGIEGPRSKFNILTKVEPHNVEIFDHILGIFRNQYVKNRQILIGTVKFVEPHPIKSFWQAFRSDQTFINVK